MIETLLILGGLLVGGLVAYVAASAQVAKRSQAQITEAERRASNAEGRASAVVQQLEHASEEAKTLRASLSTAETARVQAKTERTEALRRVEEERRLLQDARKELETAFKALAGDALHSNSSNFLTLATEKLDARESAMKRLVEPLPRLLQQLEGYVRGVEASRQTAYTSLNDAIGELRKETGNLVAALRSPKTIGSWGQMTLRRVVELCGMSEHCDFTEEVSVNTEHGRQRPDLIAHLPGGRQIVVDAKVSFDAYLEAAGASSEDARRAALEKHAFHVRQHVKKLSAKAYWDQFPEAPEFCVMFIPAESFFAAAVAGDGRLMEDAMQAHVLMATPTTLMALMRVVATAWRQEKIAKSAEEISQNGRELYDRMRVLAEHLREIGKGLNRATGAYNDAVGSLEWKVLPAARRFKELGAAPGPDIEILEPVPAATRTMTQPELVVEA
jgi:DNA recombination protein RmuC